MTTSKPDPYKIISNSQLEDDERENFELDNRSDSEKLGHQIKRVRRTSDFLICENTDSCQVQGLIKVFVTSCTSPNKSISGHQTSILEQDL